MKNTLVAILIITAAVIGLTACSTPKTMMKNPKTGQVVTCGGTATGSLVGGAIGYHMQKDNDAQCVSDYSKQGFKKVSE